jgi:uncharacterized protein YdaU (DUF1376 family)
MAIQKPEWFKMDPAKFFSDAQVDVMSTLELGACFRLLGRQWIDGHIPDDQRVLARLCRLDESSMGEAWVALSAFFPVVTPGKRANRFMWIEREKVIADLERRSDEGTRAARKRWNESRKRDAAPNAAPNGLPMLDPSAKFNSMEIAQILCQQNGWSGKAMLWALQSALEFQAKRMPEADLQQVGEWLLKSYTGHKSSKGKFAVAPQKFFEQGLFCQASDRREATANILTDNPATRALAQMEAS